MLSLMASHRQRIRLRLRHKNDPRINIDNLKFSIRRYPSSQCNNPENERMAICCKTVRLSNAPVEQGAA